MKILAIDTSAVASSAAVFENGQCVSEVFANVKLTHSQTLLPMCDCALKSAALTLNDIGAFAVSGGPGSFTGLRIGIAAIKGMAAPEGKPCCNVSSLEALAYNLCGIDGIICSVMDARCNQFYTGLFKSENGKIERMTEDRAIAADELYSELEKIEKSIFLVGDGAELCLSGADEKLRNRLILSPGHLRYARANSVALAAFNHKEDFKDCSELIPKYLRLPQAQRELLKRKKEKNKC